MQRDKNTEPVEKLQSC